MESFLLNTTTNVIGAFFGFGLALWLQRHTEKTARRKGTDLIITSITDELIDIGKSLVEYEKKAQILEYRILIPVWEAALHSGKILDLMENPMYNKIISIYANINYLNETLNRKSDKEHLKTISQLIDQIESLLKK